MFLASRPIEPLPDWCKLVLSMFPFPFGEGLWQLTEHIFGEALNYQLGLLFLPIFPLLRIKLPLWPQLSALSDGAIFLLANMHWDEQETNFERVANRDVTLQESRSAYLHKVVPWSAVAVN